MTFLRIAGALNNMILNIIKLAKLPATDVHKIRVGAPTIYAPSWFCDWNEQNIVAGLHINLDFFTTSPHFLHSTRRCSPSIELQFSPLSSQRMGAECRSFQFFLCQMPLSVQLKFKINLAHFSTFLESGQSSSKKDSTFCTKI